MFAISLAVLTPIYANLRGTSNEQLNCFCLCDEGQQGDEKCRAEEGCNDTRYPVVYALNSYHRDNYRKPEEACHH
jgi:hypothetical protein